MNFGQMKPAGFKTVLALVLACFTLAPSFSYAEKKPAEAKVEKADKDHGWVVQKTAQRDSDHVWSANALYGANKNGHPFVCALDYKIIAENGTVSHPFVFLVSRMSRELWTTDASWKLSDRDEAKLQLKIDEQVYDYTVDPENPHIFMTLVDDTEIDKILSDFAKAKKANMILSDWKKGKNVDLPLQNLEPVLESFQNCLTAPEIAYGTLKSLTKDPELTKDFKA
ncbi:hypothetical protein FAI40_03715 [Acetobacteraceae bacterium]|nr:hypothetical protein FAI40_03715 [Acetobacteraceae bacterium]